MATAMVSGLKSFPVTKIIPYLVQPTFLRPRTWFGKLEIVQPDGSCSQTLSLIGNDVKRTAKMLIQGKAREYQRNCPGSVIDNSALV